MNLLRPLSICLLLAFSRQQAKAILDTNENGLSDIWEKIYNDGDLLPETLDQLADPDGDGWTNEQEALAGTNPFDANSPFGHIATDILHSPATFSGVDGNGDPILLTPEAVTITWPTLTGKLYTLQFSPNLQAGTWINVQEPILGDGTPISIVAVLTQPNGSTPDSLFWHVKISDVDPDLDNATNYEEFILGTNSGIADTDGDGADDGIEGVGGTNGADAEVGGSPIINGRESRWIHARVREEIFTSNYISGFYHIYDPGSNKGADWVTSKDEYQSIVNSDDFAALSTAAAGFPLPEEWAKEFKGLWWTNIRKSVSGTPDLDEYAAGRLEHRLRINKKSLDVPYEFPLQVLELHWQRNAAAESPWVPEQGAVNTSILNKAVVPPGDNVSDPITYSAIPALAENRAITRTAVRFEEVEPESGFDDGVRFLQAQRFDLPWLAVADSQDANTPPHAQVKMHFSPTEQPLHLEVHISGGGNTATVAPDVTSGTSPMTLSIQGSTNFAEGQKSYEGTLRVEGIDVLNLVFYKREVVTLAVHTIVLTNDDIDEKCYYVDQTTSQPNQKVIGVGEGKADTVCIRKTDGVQHTTTIQGDDYVHLTDGSIRTGKDGICQTTAAAPDEQVIPVGKGLPNYSIVGPGPNNILNTTPNGLIANVPTSGGGVAFPQDDEVSGTSITTGPDGIRQTPLTQARISPLNVPSQTEMEEFLNRVFGRQANIWFQITQYDQADAAFDVASTQGRDAQFPALAVPNRKFDFYSNDKDENGNIFISKEEQIVQAAAKDANATFNLYYIPARLCHRLIFQNQVSVQTPEGYARSDLRTPYISALDPVNPTHSSSGKVLLGTAAHEISHSALFGLQGDAANLGLSHPWTLNHANNKVERYFPDKSYSLIDRDSDKLRLIWFSQPELTSASRFPSKLIKIEADKLHKDQ